MTQTAVVEAGPISTTWVEFSFPLSYFPLEFGPDLGFARIVAGSGSFQDPIDDAIWAEAGSFQIVGGTIQLMTGPLLDVTPTGSGFHASTHDAGGSFAIQFDLRLPDGSIHPGTFQAALGPYTIVAYDEHADAGGTEGYLGAGLFDAGTAQLLGINRHTVSGNASLYLDTHDSYPEPYRVAAAFGYVGVVATVPEPSLLLLIGIGGGAVALRSRRRTGAQ
jgi:hypothetical protein